ncbi:hypothetical protein DFJ73DRAFT_800543 [Zopfochytrium polystomum]|nr:hypothetical protein DFJ73DRAFT_800543 [Zopfochytrium polystomum]
MMDPSDFLAASSSSSSLNVQPHHQQPHHPHHHPQPAVASVQLPLPPPRSEQPLPPLPGGQDRGRAGSSNVAVATTITATATTTTEARTRVPTPFPPPPPLPPPTVPPPPANNAAAPNVSAIFRLRTWKKLRGEVPPRLNEAMPLSLFYHADEYLTRAIKNLQKLTDTSSETFRRRNERVHRAQRLLLESIYLVYQDTDDTPYYRAPRDYRRQLPADDQRELDGGYSENILYAAQALSQGFRIRGIEGFTAELVQPARELYAALEAVRFVFRSRAVRDPSPVHEDLFEVLRAFDYAWAAFEQKICFCYFSVTWGAAGAAGVQDMDMLQVWSFSILMSETILRATSRGYLHRDQIQSFDPTAIVAVPRLTLVTALRHMPDCVNITGAETPFRWFRHRVAVLCQIRDLLATCGDDEVAALERLLADADARGGGTCAPLPPPPPPPLTPPADAPCAPAAERGDGADGRDAGAGEQNNLIFFGSHVMPSVQPPEVGDIDLDNVPLGLIYGVGHRSAPQPHDAKTQDPQACERLHNAEREASRLAPQSSLTKHEDAASKEERLKSLFRSICSVSDSLSRARDFVGIMQTVFQMHCDE